MSLSSALMDQYKAIRMTIFYSKRNNKKSQSSMSKKRLSNKKFRSKSK